MGVLCPACDGRKELLIVSFLELPPDARSDEIRIQLWRCPVCDMTIVGIYEESRRGSWDSESIDHQGYCLAPSAWHILEQLIGKCPHPEDTKCRCEAHTQLNRRNEYGRWIGLDGFDLRKPFPLVLG